MEKTRRDKVIELLIIKLLKYPRRTVYDITKKWMESGMSKRKEQKLGVTKSHATFVARLKRSIKANPGRPCPSSPEAWGPPVVVPWMDSVASGTRTHSSRTWRPPTRQTCSVLAEEECAQLLGLQHLAPQQPDLNLCDYYFNTASLKASIKSEINKLDPAEVSMDCESFRCRLEDILEAE
ncbi:Hypothetical protein FKW44_012274, partial [Caligus rogercresseyi]